MLLSSRGALSTEQLCVLLKPRRSGSSVPWVGWLRTATIAAENRPHGGRAAHRNSASRRGTAPPEAWGGVLVTGVVLSPELYLLSVTQKRNRYVRAEHGKT